MSSPASPSLSCWRRSPSRSARPVPSPATRRESRRTHRPPAWHPPASPSGPDRAAARGDGMPRPLVIVESPAKAKTIARFLGGDYVVESSIGHIRDLPRGAEEVPAAYKGTAWARLGVNVDDDFKPLYVISREKKAQVQKLRSL